MAHTAPKIFPATSNLLSTEALKPNEQGKDFWKEGVCHAQGAAGALSRHLLQRAVLPVLLLRALTEP